MSNGVETFTRLRDLDASGRVTPPIAVKVTQVSPEPGVKKSARLRIQDLNRDTTHLNVWDTHSISFDWERDHWYVLVESRVKVWEGDGGTAHRRLSSTREMGIEQVGNEPPDDPSNATTTEPEGTQSRPCDEPDIDSGILDRVKEEF